MTPASEALDDLDPGSASLSQRIPTIAKGPTPYDFCYPIGASAISEAFADLPQFPLFVLSFSASSPLLQPHWQLPGYPVLRLTYSKYPDYVPRREGIRPQRQGGTRWQIEVFMVPKHKREALQPIIVEQGLVQLRAWMLGPGAPREHERRRCVEVWWFEDTAIMKLHEPEPK